MKVDGGNAVQLLLLITGITLIPALLFTVTGFTRILIVLGFIRTGLGTPTSPPNQVLVGIALFLTIFVMPPTFSSLPFKILLFVLVDGWDLFLRMRRPRRPPRFPSSSCIE